MTIELGSIPGTDLFFGVGLKKVVLDEKTMATHKHIIGTTGTGKSKTLEAIYLQCLRKGQPVTLIDPHGSSAESILQSLIGLGYYKDPKMYERVLYVEFNDSDVVFPFSMTALPFAKEWEIPELVTESFDRAYFSADMVDSVTNFNRLMKLGVRLLVANNQPITTMEELLVNKKYRETLYPRLSDPQDHSFWVHYYDALDPFHRTQFSNATLTRIQLLRLSEILKHACSQPTNGLDVRKILDEGISVIVNLGNVKDRHTKRLLGCFITHAYEVAAMSRPPYTGLSHQLLIDEFVLFAAQNPESLTDMLEQTRKYQLFLTLCHQTWSQASDKLSGSIQNTGVRISFRNGEKDAPLEAKIFASFDPTQVKSVSPSGYTQYSSVQEQTAKWEDTLRNIPDRHAVVKIGTSKPVLMQTVTVPSFNVSPQEVEKVKQEYYRRYYVAKPQGVNQSVPPSPNGRRAQP